jgi:hypothetical protein
MGQLMEALADKARRKAVIADAAVVVEQEVEKKRGLRAMGLKAGFRAFQALKPGIVPQALDKLLPAFAPVIDPLWDEAKASGRPHDWFKAQEGRVADALLGVTDGMADRAQNAMMVKIYRSLRGQARDHVIEGVPRIPELIERHAP